MSEVDARFQERLHGYDSHYFSPFRFVRPPSSSPAGTRRLAGHVPSSQKACDLSGLIRRESIARYGDRASFDPTRACLTYPDGVKLLDYCRQCYNGGGKAHT